MTATEYFFVLYKPTGAPVSKLDKLHLPDRWYEVGTGMYNTKFTREVQYRGPKSSYVLTRKRVNEFFNGIKKKGIVKYYKIIKRIPKKKRVRCVIL